MDPNAPIAGRHRIYTVDDATGLITPPRDPGWTANSWNYTWGYLACRALGQRDIRYGIGAVYLEFENVADPEDPVSPPATAREDTIDYYEGLSASADRDFLRIPIAITPSIGVVPGFEAYFAEGQGNRLIVHAQSGGTVGVHGKAFSDVANSKVFGIAVVGMPDRADRTKDILFARSYYAADKQQVKAPTGQIHGVYELDFK
jgi:hypothetical protein